MSEENKKTSEIEISFFERLYMMFDADLLPKSGSFLTIIVAEEFAEKIKLDSKDLSDVNYVEDLEKGTSKWDGEKAKALSLKLKLSEDEVKVLQDGVNRLDSKERITRENLELAKKIRAL